jgi:complement component 1 Q subcomponent-binding protein, mitochondrial
VSDAPRAQDVLLRRRDGSEEVLVSALLAPLRFVGRDPLPRAALVKVFVSKPGAAPVLHFDCRASWVGEEERGGGAADYAINAVRYHSSPGAGGADEYEGPAFRWVLLVCPACFFFFSFKNTSADAVFFLFPFA